MKAYPDLPEEQSEHALYFMNLLADDCRWPIGNDMFCGAPAEVGKPYCPSHCDRAYPARKLRHFATKEGKTTHETVAASFVKDLTPKHIGATMHTGSILIVKPNQMPPEELLDKLVAANKTLLGFAGVSNGAIDIDHLDNAKLDFKANVLELKQAFLDSWCMFYFAENKTLIKEDYMPMCLADNEQKGKLIAVAAEGDFPGLIKKGDAHIPEYNLIMDHLAEDVDDILNEANGDLDKAAELLNSARFRKSLKQHMVPRGSVSLLLANNSVITFGEKTFDAGEVGYVGEWGSVSRRFGWEPPKPKAETVTAIAEPDYANMSAIQRIKARKEYEAKLLDAQGDAPITEEPGKTSVPGTGLQPRVLEPTTTSDLDTVTCPETGKKQRKEWMWKHFGQSYQFPAGWMEKNFKFPAKDLLPTSPIRTFLDDEKRKREGKAVLAQGQQADTEQPGVSTEVFPSLSPQSQEQAMNLIRDGVLKMDPGQVQAVEKPFDKFTDQLNLNEDVPFMWKTEAYLTLAQNNAMAAASLMEQMRRRVHALDPSLSSRMLSKMQGPHKTDVPTDEDLSGLSAIERLRRRKAAAAA